MATEKKIDRRGGSWLRMGIGLLLGALFLAATGTGGFGSPRSHRFVFGAITSYYLTSAWYERRKAH